MGNRPVNFNDPTGHFACGDGEEKECGTGKKQDPNKNPHPNWSPMKKSGGGNNNDPTDDLETGPMPAPYSGNNKMSDAASIDILWPDDWFEYHCPGITSCVGQYVKYYTFTFGTAIPNSLTGTVIGWHGVFTLNQYGDWFFGLGLDAGKNLFGVNVSLVEGRFANDQLPGTDSEEQKFLRKFLTSNSFQGFLVPIFYIGANYSPSVNEFTVEDGAGIPQGGGAWTYSWLISGGKK